MSEMTISQVSKTRNVSTRMLRYYEQAGLIKSYRREGYAYRLYDEEAVSRIEQILLLRKLRIPVRQIRVILDNENALTAIQIFREKIFELEEEITALSTIKEVFFSFIQELVKATSLPLNISMTGNDTLLSVIEALKARRIDFSEEKNMDKRDKAKERVSKLRDVRIVYLPPSTVAAAHVIGDDPERQVSRLLDAFVQKNNLNKIKPDLRRYGFNHPNPVDETGYHGYEAWVTIPQTMEVPAPLIKKQFSGGLYGAHMIHFGEFAQWDAFLEWVYHNESYEFAGDIQDQQHMCGLLEEQLNYFSYIEGDGNELKEMQIDLLIPIRKKEKEEDRDDGTRINEAKI